jgi:hypothetical protein
MNSSQTPFRPFRNVGFWLVLLLAASQLSNAFRVALDAPAFSNYMGLPLHDFADASWVHVYALRALFLGLFAGFLLWTRQYRVLASMALIAVVMPLGDFWLVWQQDGSTFTLARHALIAAALVAAWFFLGRTARAADRNPG